ncbi:hypothetical protein TSMEX_006986 [Taenia solium]|eukprot:TsM_001088600 transcript=TsM_001088600 gene=TsM_001088600
MMERFFAAQVFPGKLRIRQSLADLIAGFDKKFCLQFVLLGSFDQRRRVNYPLLDVFGKAGLAVILLCGLQFKSENRRREPYYYFKYVQVS